jgi:hypothetical protein
MSRSLRISLTPNHGFATPRLLPDVADRLQKTLAPLRFLGQELIEG